MQDTELYTMLYIHTGLVHHNKTHSPNQSSIVSPPFWGLKYCLKKLLAFCSLANCPFFDQIKIGVEKYHRLKKRERIFMVIVECVLFRAVRKQAKRLWYTKMTHGQELITFHANHICVVYVFLVQKLSRLKRYLLLPASRNRGITSRKLSARILTCGASRRRYVLYGK